MKLLGLNTLTETVEDMASYTSQLPSAEEINKMVKTLDTLTKENETLKKSLAELSEKVEEIEIPDMDDYVRECDLDIDSAIYDYLSSNDYATSEEVKDCVEEAIEDANIEEKVRDLFNDASPAPMSEEDIKKEVSEAVKVTLEKMVKALADQQG